MPAENPTRKKWLTIWLAILILPVLLYNWYSLTKHVIIPALQPWPDTGRLWPNSAYWVAARIVLEGHPEWLYDDTYFGAESIRLGAHHDIFAANLPSTVLVFLPIGVLPLGAAFTLWTIASVLFLLAAWLALLYALRVHVIVALGLTALLPL